MVGLLKRLTSGSLCSVVNLCDLQASFGVSPGSGTVSDTQHGHTTRPSGTEMCHWISVSSLRYGLRSSRLGFDTVYVVLVSAHMRDTCGGWPIMEWPSSMSTTDGHRSRCRIATVYVTLVSLIAHERVPSANQRIALVQSRAEVSGRTRLCTLCRA